MRHAHDLPELHPRHRLFCSFRLISAPADRSDGGMGEEDDAARRAIAALAADTAAAWDAFVRLVSVPAWRAAVRSTPRRAVAESLFSRIMADLHADRLALAARLDAARLPEASAFLDREIDRHIGCWVFDLFLTGSADGAEALVRVFDADLRAWVQRALPFDERSQRDDRVQDCYAALLADGGQRLRAWGGDAPFRAFLRSTVINLVADVVRREHGRPRPRAAFARLSGLQQRAYRLIFEERVSSAEAARRLSHADSADAVAAVMALGDLGATHSGGRPKMVALDTGGDTIEIAGERDSPEDILLAREEMAARITRETALLAALRAMPARQRDVLEQRFLLGRKPREIAAVTGTDVKDIYRILERALAQIKSDLVRP
jgi:RNA polymerase sigma factor (sigma-70 family)